jgi:hypothetical protein
VTPAASAESALQGPAFPTPDESRAAEVPKHVPSHRDSPGAPPRRSPEPVSTDFSALLAPLSSGLARSFRWILEQLGAGYVDRRRAARDVGSVLPNLLYRSEEYRRVREDLLGWAFPGRGLEPKETDGEWASAMHAHDGERHVQHFRILCGRGRCAYSVPDISIEEQEAACWRVWYRRAAGDAAERISWARVATMRPEESVIHVTLSPRPTYTDDGPVWDRHLTRSGYRALRSEAHALLHAAGLKGWVLVPHHVRVSAGRWSAAHCPVPGFHFHALAHGYVRRTPAGGWGDLYPRFDGWFLRNLRVRKSIYATLEYVLSHCGLTSRAPPPGPVCPPNGESFSSRSPTEAVVWGGDWSPRAFKVPEPTEEAIPVRLCETCGRLRPEFEWVRAIWVGLGPPLHVPGVARPDEWRAVSLPIHSPKVDAEEDLFAFRPSRHDSKKPYAAARAENLVDAWRVERRRRMYDRDSSVGESFAGVESGAIE